MFAIVKTENTGLGGPKQMHYHIQALILFSSL